MFYDNRPRELSHTSFESETSHSLLTERKPANVQPLRSYSPRSSIFLEHNFGNGMFAGVRNREVRGGRTALFEQFARPAMKQNEGCA